MVCCVRASVWVERAGNPGDRFGHADVDLDSDNHSMPPRHVDAQKSDTEAVDLVCH